MILRLLLVSAVLLSTTACKKQTADILAGIDYSFFDAFDRADSDFSSDTVYDPFPNPTGVIIANQTVKGVSSFFSLIRLSSFSISNVGLTLKVSHTSGDITNMFGGPAMTEQSDLNSGRFLICGFSYGQNLTLIGTGEVSLATGTTAFDLSTDQDLTYLFTGNGTTFTCTATAGSQTDTITHTFGSPESLPYKGFYFVDNSNTTSADDFGVFDVDANTRSVSRIHRRR